MGIDMSDMFASWETVYQVGSIVEAVFNNKLEFQRINI